MVRLKDVLQLLLDEIPFDRVLTRENLRPLGTISVVKHSEDNLRKWVGRRGMMWRRHHRGQVVLQSFAEDRVEGQVGSDDVLLDPHFASQTFDLLPKAVQVLEIKNTRNV